MCLVQALYKAKAKKGGPTETAEDERNEVPCSVFCELKYMDNRRDSEEDNEDGSTDQCWTIAVENKGIWIIEGRMVGAGFEEIREGKVHGE